MMKQLRSIETHQRIMEFALQSFSSSGYQSTRITDICEKAQISKGAFYHHFNSKQEVFVALLNQWLSEIKLSFQQFENTSSSVPEAITKMAETMPEIYSAARGRYFIILEFWLQASRTPDIWDVAVQPYRQFKDDFAHLIQKGISEGSFSTEINPLMASQTVISLALGFLLQAFFDPDGADWGLSTTTAVQSLLNSWK